MFRELQLNMCFPVLAMTHSRQAAIPWLDTYSSESDDVARVIVLALQQGVSVREPFIKVSREFRG